MSERIPPQGSPPGAPLTPQQRWAARRAARRRRPWDTRLRAMIWFSISLLAFATAIIYLLLPTDKLPRFLPGYDPAAALHATQSSVVCCFLAVFTLLAGMVTLASGGVPKKTPVRTGPYLGAPARTAAPQRIRTVPPADRRR